MLFAAPLRSCDTRKRCAHSACVAHDGNGCHKRAMCGDMQQALKNELTCSECLCVFTDPVRHGLAALVQLRA